MNEKISCIIVDDEPAALGQLLRYVEKTPILQIAGSFNSAIEVLEYLQLHPAPQLIFLDIQMPDLSGMELAKNLPPETGIIFTTAFDQFAVAGYKVNAIDYLLKPINYAEFLTATTKAMQRIREKDLSKEIAKKEAPEIDYIFIKSEYKQMKITLPHIIYIEGLKDYAKIYLTTESAPILSLISLKKLEEELPSSQFMRVHRSFIVALDKIDHIERNQIIIGDQRITIAEQYRGLFHEFISKRSI